MQLARSLPATYPLWPSIRLLLTTIGLAYCIGVLLGVFPYNGSTSGLLQMADGYAYWSADLSNLYGGTLGSHYAFLYSPVSAQITEPLRILPWPVFAWGWFALHVLVLWKLDALWMLAIPLVADDAIRGNVHTFYAFALVAPVWMAVPLLTKITPGVALLGMKDWRGLWVAVGLAALSALIAPHLWVEWVGVLRDSSQQQGAIGFPFPLLVRLPFAIVAAWMGRKRRWLLPVAMLLATPHIWPASFAVLAAIPRLTTSGSDCGRGCGDPPAITSPRAA